SIPVSVQSFNSSSLTRVAGDSSPHQVIFRNWGELFGRHDPNLHLAQRNGVSILPAALYRRQLPNSDFPDVTGDVIQVSPVLERIAIHRVSALGDIHLKDPFVGVEAFGTRTVEWKREGYGRPGE